MKKKIEDIKRDVRIIVDENDEIDHLLEIEDDPDALMTDEITEAMVLRAIDKVHQMAPLPMVAEMSKTLPLNTLQQDMQYGIRLTLPADWLRLVSAKMTGWQKVVTDAVDEDSREYLMQMSDFAGIRATARKPVVAIVPNSHGAGMVLEAYPKGNDTTVSVRYVGMAEIKETQDPGETDKTKKTEIATRCYDAVLYMIANLYLQSVGETEKAKVMAMECAEMLGLSGQEGV